MQNVRDLGKKHSTKIIAGVITLAVLTLLLFAGPARAFDVVLNGFATANPTQGDKISTTATITINSNERMIMPNPVGVYIDGSEEAFCSFNLEATSGDCDGSDGIKVELVSSTSDGKEYGYGYGYGYDMNTGYGYGYDYQNGYSQGTYTYTITMDTSKFDLGDHTIQLSVDAGQSHIYPSEVVSVDIQGETSGVTYSQDFFNGQTPDGQCTAWNDFRDNISSSASYEAVTIKGSNDLIGVSCTGENANNICQALKSGTYGEWDCGGRIWETGSCGEGMELSASGSICDCSSSSSQDNPYKVRPCIGNENWGGVNTDTCGGPSQTLTVICGNDSGDKTAPTVTLYNPEQGSYQPSDVPFNFTYTDNVDSSINCTLYVGGQPSGSVFASNGVEASGVYVANEERVYSLYVSCTDAAGNTGDSKENTFTVDATAPITTASGTEGFCAETDGDCGDYNFDGTWAEDKVNVHLSCSDDSSGCEDIYYLINGAENTDYEDSVASSGTFNRYLSFDTPGYYNITFWGVDKAGNVEDTQSKEVMILAPGPENIGGEFEFPAGASPDSTPNVTVAETFTINVSTGNGTSEVILQEGTVITMADGTNFNLSALSGNGDVNLSSLLGLDSNLVLDGAIQWGIPNLGLIFSKPITIKFFIGNSFNGQTLDVRRSVSGTANWTQDGIEPPKTCLVTAGICEFNATKASYYATTTGSASAKATEGQSTSKGVLLLNSTSPGASNNGPGATNNAANNGAANGGAGITGAVIGGGIIGWTGIIILAIVIVGLAIILVVRRKGKGKVEKK